MPRQYGLGPLKVRVGRHQDVALLLRKLDKFQLERGRGVDQVVYRIASPEPQVQRDLIVAAAAGVKLLAWRAYAIRERLLNYHVDVFQLDRHRQSPGVDVVGYLEQAAPYPGELGLADQTHLAQHLGMGNRADNVVAPQLAVDVYAGDELRGDGVCFRGQAPVPRLLRS